MGIIYLYMYSLNIHFYACLYTYTYHTHTRKYFSRPRTKKHPMQRQTQQHTTRHLLCCYSQWPPRHQPWIRAACSYTASCHLKRQNAAVGGPEEGGWRHFTAAVNSTHTHTCHPPLTIASNALTSALHSINLLTIDSWDPYIAATCSGVRSCVGGREREI